ncbi:MAG: N-acetylmuramoyl-L-alanine amidase [Ginsengibacter sp.]
MNYLHRMKMGLFILLSFCFLSSFSQIKLPVDFYVKTIDSLPYLKYGIGEDRLGGTKMTFLDSNIILKVVDSFGTDYKVQLSQFHTAWIDKNNVSRTEVFIPQQHLTGGWKVFGDSLFDYVTVLLDQKLPYTSVQEIHPSRIVIDIFGATSNTNWINQLSSAKEIKNAWYEQVEDDVMRIFIELKHPQHWGYSIFYDSTSYRLTVKVKRQPPILNLKNLSIAIDAGHGGDNTGATGVKTRIKEKDYTLLIAYALKKELELKKANVIMTRTKDTTLGMPERLSFLKQQNPDLLISIHLNSASSDTTQGVSIYYRYIGFKPLSVAILNSVEKAGLKEFGNIGSFNFSLSGPTEYPNCLLEVAFLSNPEDEKKILSPAFRSEVAKRIVAGIEDFLENL